MKLKLLAMIACSVSLTLAGCGSDTTTEPAGGNNTSYPKATGAISKIAANGDVTVGAVTYDTAGAVIDTQGSGDLTVGMTVTVEGPTTGNEGTAHKIKYDSEVEGLVTANDITTDTNGMTGGMLTVMGQTIIINAETKFFNKMTHEMIATPATDIAIGNVVEVSGMMSDVGIVASLVVLKAETLEPGEEIEVKGFVTGYDMDLATFNLGECEVVITPDTKFDGFDMLSEGMFVEVKSTADKISMTGMCTIEALVIENEDEDEAMKDMAKVEGTVISGLTDDGMFEMVDVDDTTVVVKLQQDVHYVNGDATSIVVDAKLKVKGTYDDMGVLLAAKILFEDINNPVPPMPQGPKVKIDAYVDAVDVTAGTLTVLGQAVMITDLTELVKEPLAIPAPAPADPNNPMPVATGTTTTPAEMMIGLGDIVEGDYVHVMIEVDDAGKLVATLVVVENMSGSEVLMSKIYGSISEATIATDMIPGMMTVEGVKVVVNDLTMIEPVEYDLSLIAENIAAGTALEALVKGVYDATTGELTADQIVVHVESTMMM